MSEISYLTVYLHEKAREDASFDMTLKQETKEVIVGHEKDAHLNKKKKLINKTTQDVHEKPQRTDKKPRFEQEHNILAQLSLYYVWERDQFYN